MVTISIAVKYGLAASIKVESATLTSEDRSWSDRRRILAIGTFAPRVILMLNPNALKRRRGNKRPRPGSGEETSPFYITFSLLSNFNLTKSRSICTSNAQSNQSAKILFCISSVASYSCTASAADKVGKDGDVDAPSMIYKKIGGMLWTDWPLSCAGSSSP